jgi:hypothetical protein
MFTIELFMMDGTMRHSYCDAKMLKLWLMSIENQQAIIQKIVIERVGDL